MRARDYDALSDGCARCPPAAKGWMWAPYLLGERTPHLDPEVRAAFAGIGTTTTAAALCARGA